MEVLSKLIASNFTGHSQTLEQIISEIDSLKLSCTGVVSIIAPEDGETPMQFSYQLFKKSEDIITASFDQFRVIFDSVHTLRGLIATIEASQKQLAKMTLPLKMITVQYRITASTMDDATRQEFEDLADKLASLIDEINSRLEKQFSDLAETSSVCATVIEGLETMVKDYEVQLNRQLGTSRGNLGELCESLDDYSKQIAALTGSSERLSESIFGIMVSMQAQDMSSQKLEHICEALDSICNRLSSCKQSEEPAALFFAKEATRIQRTQLSTLLRDLDTATGSIESRALSTESEIASMARATEELSDIGSQTHLLKSSAESIRNILHFVEVTINKTRSLLVSIKPLREKFKNSTSRVLNIAAEMRMVAVNAQVYASNVSDGEALEVLSHSTQSQSMDAKKNIESISVNLEKVAQSLAQTEDSLTSFADMGQGDMDQLLAESQIAQSELRQLEMDLPARIEQVQVKRDKVAQTTRDFVQRLSEEDGSRRLSRGALSLFGQIAKANITLPSPRDIQIEKEKLLELKQNYTMQSEVDLHDGNASSAPDAAANSSEIDFFESPDADSEPDAQQPSSVELSTSAMSDAKLPVPPESEQEREAKPAVKKLDDNVELF